MGTWPEMMPKGGWRGAAYLGPCRSRGLCLIPRCLREPPPSSCYFHVGPYRDPFQNIPLAAPRQGQRGTRETREDGHQGRDDLRQGCWGWGWNSEAGEMRWALGFFGLLRVCLWV